MIPEEVKTKPFVLYPDGQKGRVVSFNDSSFTVQDPQGRKTIHEWEDAPLLTVLERRPVPIYRPCVVCGLAESQHDWTEAHRYQM